MVVVPITHYCRLDVGAVILKANVSEVSFLDAEKDKDHKLKDRLRGNMKHGINGTKNAHITYSRARGVRLAAVGEELRSDTCRWSSCRYISEYV